MEDTSLVFLIAAFATMTFVWYPCSSPGCKGKLQVDGQQLGLMRQTAKTAFGLCLMYAWWAETKLGGLPWFRFWRRTLAGYWRCLSVLQIACCMYVSTLQGTSEARCLAHQCPSSFR